MSEQYYYTTQEVASIWKLNRKTVERWCRWGRIPAIQLQPNGGPWRIPQSVIQQGGHNGKQTIAATDKR